MSLPDFVDQDLVSGEHYRISPNVTSDGIWNIYQVESEYGPFVVHGTDLLRERIQEIRAITALKSQDEVLLVGRGGVRYFQHTGESLFHIVRRPGETVEGIQPGVRRAFDSAKRSISREIEKRQEAEAQAGASDGVNASLDSSIVSVANTGRSLAERAIGVSDAERRWAKKLGVDPYSRNPILQAQLEKVGVLESSGTLAAGIATPAPLALTIAARVSDIVWEEPPGQLETHIESTLAKIGVGSSASRRFKLNPYFTLSRQVVFVDTLAGLPHVSGHADLVARASHADSEELAVFFTEAASMLAAFDKNQDRVDQLLPEAILVAARTERDRIVHFLPCDSVFWSAELSRNAAEVSRQMKENYPGATFEIVLSGRASDQARRGFEDLGWTVYEKVNTERD